MIPITVFHDNAYIVVLFGVVGGGVDEDVFKVDYVVVLEPSKG